MGNRDGACLRMYTAVVTCLDPSDHVLSIVLALCWQCTAGKIARSLYKGLQRSHRTKDVLCALGNSTPLSQFAKC